MATNQTANYQLNQWEPTDQVLRTDFNADNAKLDAALLNKAEAAELESVSGSISVLSAAVAEHTAALERAGNCQIHYTTYAGTGTYGATNRTTIAFPKRVLLAVVADSGGGSVLAIRGMGTGYRREHSASYVNLSWGVQSLSMWHPDSAEGQMNRAGVTYYVVGLLAEDI